MSLVPGRTASGDMAALGLHPSQAHKSSCHLAQIWKTSQTDGETWRYILIVEDEFFPTLPFKMLKFDF